MTFCLLGLVWFVERTTTLRIRVVPKTPSSIDGDSSPPFFYSISLLFRLEFQTSLSYGVHSSHNLFSCILFYDEINERYTCKFRLKVSFLLLSRFGGQYQDNCGIKVQINKQTCQSTELVSIVNFTDNSHKRIHFKLLAN